MRQYIIDDVLTSFNYRDSEGNRLFTTTVSFLLLSEIEEINKLGFSITPIKVGYNLINFNHPLE